MSTKIDDVIKKERTTVKVTEILFSLFFSFDAKCGYWLHPTYLETDDIYSVFEHDFCRPRGEGIQSLFDTIFTIDNFN